MFDETNNSIFFISNSYIIKFTAKYMLVMFLKTYKEWFKFNLKNKVFIKYLEPRAEWL